MASTMVLASLLSASCKERASKGSADRATTMVELYSLKSVPTFDIKLTEDVVNDLRKTPKKWALGDFEYAGEKFASVSVRLKGHRSLRSSDDKQAIKLRFNKGKDNRGRRFLGVHRLTLNNLVEDPTMIREYLAYRLARKVGLPVPKAGFANITINGEPRGLYLVVETPDKEFLKRQFGSGKGELYEGEYGCDLFVADVDGFEQDEGKEDRGPLLRFAKAAEASGDEVWRPGGPVTIEHLSLFLAFSTYVGDFDGYHHSHNYRIYREPTSDTWQFMSWGLDRAFFKTLPPYSSKGLLAKRCFSQSDCRKAYLLNLRRVHEAALALDLITGAKVISVIIADSVNADTKRPHSAKTIIKRRKKLTSFLVGRDAYVKEYTQCLDSSGNEIDRDGDGFACTDCDDTNASVFPGAAETCDSVDNNCSGLVDDAPNCPCPTELLGNTQVLLCDLPMPYNAAEKHCRARGAVLASAANEPELHELRRMASSHNKGRWWLGANDRSSEGQFRWMDGSDVSDTLWAKGEPDNTACNQDCSILHDGSKPLLHDTHCGQYLPFICELPVTR